MKLSEQQKHADVEQLSSMLVQGRRLAGELKSMSWVKRHRLHLVMVLIGTTVIISAISTMNPGQRCNQGGRASYTADVGAAKFKNPPSVVTERFWILFSSVLAVSLGFQT